MHEQSLLAPVNDQRRPSIAAFSQSELEFRRLLEKLPAGAYTCDRQGLITYFNQQAERLWGRAPRLNDPIDRFCGSFKLYAADGSPISHDECWMARALERDEEFNGQEIIIERPDGQRLTALAHANPIRDEYGHLLGAVNVLVDITDRKRAEQALREADRSKDDFLALLGHELRNPLAAIVNGVSMLRRMPAGDDRQQRIHELLDRQARHMQRLVDDLLDLSRISRGKIALRPERLDLADLVARVAEDHRPAAEESGHSLEVDRTPEPLWVQGDATRLAQIVGNLLHNAFKFSDGGGRITLSARADLVSGSAAVSVRDTGIGMCAVTLGRLFEPFSQSDGALDRSHGGLGLGLALVKGLAELHGGSVTAHSAGSGQGSEFTVRLPLASSATAESADAVTSGRPAGRSYRTLLVEDSQPVAEIFAMLLRELGHDVDVVGSGAAALERIPDLEPEVVFSDISMPGMSGYELARRIREQAHGEDVFLVAMTGFGQPEDRQRALDAGFDEHVIKPAELDRLEGVFAAISRRKG
ncbi:MAG TPA: ATP-binding protein [Planctomycetaceae bacterium]|nr:ATP-binding protein [Planctomycetaceae bacterium]